MDHPEGGEVEVGGGLHGVHRVEADEPLGKPERPGLEEKLELLFRAGHFRYF